MSYDIPQIHIPDGSLEAHVLESIISRENITLEEVVRRAIRGMEVEQPSLISTPKRTSEGEPVAPLTDAELAHLDSICPALKLLDEVTDEEWNSVIAGARDLNREGFSNRV